MSNLKHSHNNYYCNCRKFLLLCGIHGNELGKIDIITGAPFGINPSLLTLCVSIHGKALHTFNWGLPVKKGRKAQFKFYDKTLRHIMRKENFRVSISTQVGQYGRYYCAHLIHANYFCVCLCAIWFAKFKLHFSPLFYLRPSISSRRSCIL